MRLPRVSLLCLAALARAASARAQAAPWTLLWQGADAAEPEALVSLDHDDDDDDGVPDLVAPPASDDELARVGLRGVSAPSVRVTVSGGLRLVAPAGLTRELTAPVRDGRVEVTVVGVEASAAPRDASITFAAGALTRAVPVTVAAAAFLRGDNAALFAHRDAASVSHQVTLDETLPRASPWDGASPDLDNLRVEVWDPGATADARARLEALGTAASVGVAPGALRGQLADLPVTRDDAAYPLRSRFVRLVGDELDVRAAGVQGQTLLVGLRDRVRVRYRRAGAAGEATSDLRVGRPGDEDGPLAARIGSLRVRVAAPRRGAPVVGDTEAGALAIARRQVQIANEVYLQCAVTWGDPARADVAVVEPARDALLSVGNDDGLDAAGGAVRVMVNSTPVGPVAQRPGATPAETARDLAAAIRAAGFSVRVTRNPRTDYGAAGSVDLVARDRAGRIASFAPVRASPLSTDARQSVTIGRVDLGDGVDEFNNLNSSSGTLEERALLHPLVDDDPRTLEIFLVNRFARGTRIGEAFVEGAGGAVVNALLVDRGGISAEREAWTQSHEAGHILLDQPWHPDNMGPDRPWLLMDADASLGAVTGPKRLTDEECARLHQQSGVGAVPPLFARYDVRRPSPRAAEMRAWPAAPLYRREAPPTRRQTPASEGPAAPTTAPAREVTTDALGVSVRG